MSARRVASRALLVLGALALAGALALMIAGYTLPSEGFQDLARFAGALLLAGGAGVALALGLFLADGARAWLALLAGAGCLAAMGAGLVLLRVGTTGALIFGALFLLAGGAGVARAVVLTRKH